MMTRPIVRWAIVVLFAIAMAWVESASVYYLRVLVDRVEPYQPTPLPIAGVLGGVELAREAATLIMLATLGALAGTTWPARVAYSAIAFGVWDICYYVFLWIMGGWPTSLMDWDILFLLPLPWWGPVLAPVGIAALMIAGGTLVTQSRRVAMAPGVRVRWAFAWPGIALALYVFMADALQAVTDGRDAAASLPTHFNWPLFGVALLLMAAPIAQTGWRVRRLSGPGGDL
jgi:hypothetical protein